MKRFQIKSNTSITYKNKLIYSKLKSNEYMLNNRDWRESNYKREENILNKNG